MKQPLFIVHTESSCGWGGQEIRILSEAAGMIKRGHKVMLLCPEEAPIFAAASAQGVPVQALPIARKGWRGVKALRHWLGAHPGVSLINTHSSTDSWLTALACVTLRHSPPIVRTRHVSSIVPANRPTRWLYGKATRHVVTTGEALRRQLHRDNGLPLEHLTSVPTGIDLSRFLPGDKAEARKSLGLKPEGFYLGIVSTLRSWKGHDYLLEAMTRLITEYPDLQLLIVGDGPQRENLEGKIIHRGLDAKVKLVGQRDDVPLWLNALDVFTLPSYGEEGVPQAIMQAMACGVPVVSTDVGAISEAVKDGETGIMVAPRDSIALTVALSRLLADAELRRCMGAAGFERARERFGSEVMLDKMEAVFIHTAGRG
ncbi:MAG: glycosyltransferase family 4 protein [Pseudomonadota bacterium]|nr:glycosyltransferase family 4 protein [Gammaproteobacteria bacterium]MBU1732197.1 glycosyltransferase family 4 protein [Gammaproteobacteria bacterium]MBU1893273.1 glycosyltransferase family 4 protein [Gammaproteobacteria bacterium]